MSKLIIHKDFFKHYQVIPRFKDDDYYKSISDYTMTLIQIEGNPYRKPLRLHIYFDLQENPDPKTYFKDKSNQQRGWPWYLLEQITEPWKYFRGFYQLQVNTDELATIINYLVEYNRNEVACERDEYYRFN